VFVIPAALFHAERFGYGDLHVIYVAAIPDGLENAVGEAEDQDVLHGLFAQVMIDAIDLAFGEDLADFLVEGAGRIDVVTEGLFDDDAAPVAARFVGEAGGAELLHDGSDERRRGGEVIEVIAVGAVLPVDIGERGLDALANGMMLYALSASSKGAWDHALFPECS
jgi:hypothetical protein